MTVTQLRISRDRTLMRLLHSLRKQISAPSRPQMLHPQKEKATSAVSCWLLLLASTGHRKPIGVSAAQADLLAYLGIRVTHATAGSTATQATHRFQTRTRARKELWN